MASRDQLVDLLTRLTIEDKTSADNRKLLASWISSAANLATPVVDGTTVIPPNVPTISESESETDSDNKENPMFQGLGAETIEFIGKFVRACWGREAYHRLPQKYDTDIKITPKKDNNFKENSCVVFMNNGACDDPQCIEERLGPVEGILTDTMYIVKVPFVLSYNKIQETHVIRKWDGVGKHKKLDMCEIPVNSKWWEKCFEGKCKWTLTGLKQTLVRGREIWIEYADAELPNPDFNTFGNNIAKWENLFEDMAATFAEAHYI
jgi:hypothetical protein